MHVVTRFHGMRGVTVMLLAVVGLGCTTGSDEPADATSGGDGGFGAGTGVSSGQDIATSADASTVSASGVSATSTSAGATTSTSGSTTSSSAGASTTGSSAQTTGAGGGACAETPCKLVAPQCGCPPDEMCAIDNTGQRACLTAGTAAPGAACGPVDCAPGGICLGTGNLGFCGEFCKTDSDCNAPAICILGVSDGNGGTVPNAALCSSNCSPTTSAGCPTGMGCQIVQEDLGAMRYGFTCTAAGTKTKGQPCASSSDCAPNFGCYNIGNALQCARNCNTFNDQCPGAETCNALVDLNAQPIVVNGIGVGVCI
jgi:hypothetical protein